MSPKMIANQDFEQSALLSKSSKLDQKDSNSEVIWLRFVHNSSLYSCIFASLYQTSVLFRIKGRI